jgi:hypothetical protein
MIDRQLVAVEAFKAALSLIVLAAGWFVGQRIIVGWEIRKKRQELDIAAAERFQVLYGEIKAVARLWRARLRPVEGLHPPDNIQWTLLERATKAEGQYEAIVIKLATERKLTASQTSALGLFRQGVQQVRESIRDGKIVEASGFGPEYLLFNELAAEVTCLIGSTRQKDVLDGHRAKTNLEEIALIRLQDWHKAVREFGEKRWPHIREDKNANAADS